MSIPKRRGSVPGTYFVTSRTWEGRAIFKTVAPCKIFADVLLHYRDEANYWRHAFVLVPDHFHLLLTPGSDVSLERALQFVKGGSARSIREALHFRFPIWQRGFSDHRIRNAEDLDLHLRYVEQNPVKKGLAVEPREFIWSSASGSFRMDEFPQRLKPLSAEAAIGTAEAVP